MRRFVVLASAAAAVGLFAVITTTGSAKPVSGGATFRVIQTITSLRIAGNDVIITQEEKTPAGRHVATTQVVCATIVAPRSECFATHLFSGHTEISAMGPSDLSKAVQYVAIIGGTGAYAGAKGWIRVKRLSLGKTESTFHIVP